MPEYLKRIAPWLEQPIRLFFQDESRFGLMLEARRRITARGRKPLSPVSYVFAYYYLYAVVEPLTGANFFLEMPALNGLCFQVFLDEFAKHYAKSFNVVILDNGAFHKAKHLMIPDNVLLLFLPPYCPELNPVERLWQDIKKAIRFGAFEDLWALKEEEAQIVRRYSEAEVASLTGYGYVSDAINVL